LTYTWQVPVETNVVIVPHPRLEIGDAIVESQTSMLNPVCGGCSASALRGIARDFVSSGRKLTPSFKYKIISWRDKAIHYYFLQACV